MSRRRVAFLGPQYTNSHEAAVRLFGSRDPSVPCPTITRVFDAVESGEADLGVVPAENAIEGTVRETLDNLIVRPPQIAQELELPIEHCLARKRDATGPVARVLSHVQALSQCRRYLDKNFPEALRLAVSSTAQAAHDAALDPQTLAITPRAAAEALGLEILNPNVSDQTDNSTRFIVIGPEDGPPSPDPITTDKTSLVFVAPHERGGLRKILGVFDDVGVNLTRIESRPLVGLHGPKWEYAFIVDAEGHRLVPPLADAIASLREMGSLVRVLGSYPRALTATTRPLDVSAGSIPPGAPA